MSKFAVLIMAAGQSTRFGDKHFKKPFVALEDRAVWIHSAERFLAREDVVQVLVVISEEDEEEFKRRFGANLAFMNIQYTTGGVERSDSVKAGLAKLSAEATHVAVHDAARPCLADGEIDKVFEAAVKHDAAILATPVASTLKRVEGSIIVETVPRESLWAAQTPQVFTVELLGEAHNQASSGPVTDDAQLVEQLGKSVHIVEGSEMNIKITRKSDLSFASAILKGRPRPKPDGFAHPFADDDLWR